MIFITLLHQFVYSSNTLPLKPNRSRGGGGAGKYRQRHQTNQHLGGMDGLDIDLVESIAPTSSAANPSDSRRNRHATNNRKVNLTHLLNYKLERQPRRRYKSNSSSQGDNSGGRGGNSGHHHHHVHHNRVGGSGGSTQFRDPGIAHKFSKQQFLQANCQFVVLDGHDYSVHKADPDWPVDWDCIEEVRFKQIASSETTCPICLEPPIAAKITRCGHIYCWTCMLHYLSLSDEKCRQCPICFEFVYRNDLRSVVSHSFTNYSVDEEIVMRLMIRKKGCVEVEPYKYNHHHQQEHLQSNQLHEMTEEPNLVAGCSGADQPYLSQANLVIVDPQTVNSNITQRERNELQFKLSTDRDEPEVCFIEQALDALEKRIEKLKQTHLSPSASGNAKFKFRDTNSPSMQPHSRTNNVEDSKTYLFYQCSDGQHIYLNPFSTKILCHEYESLENSPLEIRAKILQMDWVSMSEAWRRRFRYLEHLPLTCEFRLIEIDFEKSNLVSQETLSVFNDQILKRRQERDRRRREERKREKIIQVEQNRRIYGIQPSLKINLDNTEQFPSVSDERYLGLTQPRNQGRTDDYISSDEDEENGTREARATTNAVVAQPITDVRQPENELQAKPDPIVADVTLSFAEIQLQEAAKEAAAAKTEQKSKNNPAVSGGWGRKNTSAQGGRLASASTGGGNGSGGSFAKLLEDAKTSQKTWTRNASAPKVQSFAAPRASNPMAHLNSSQRSRKPTDPSNPFEGDDDDGGEELRAPPCNFTISDFMDMNVKSGKKNGKSKKN